MSMLHVGQIQNHVLDVYQRLVDMSDIRTNVAEERMNFLLTRSLVAYSVQHIAQIDPKTAADSVTDGSEDNGIDAIYYDERNRVLYIAQSKWIKDGIGEPDSGDVGKFVDGVRNLFNCMFDRFNEKISKKQGMITRALTDSQARIQLILCYTGASELSVHSRRKIEDFLQEMNDTSEIVFCNVLNQKSLHQSLASGLAGKPIDLESVTLKSWGRIEEPHLAFYGQVSGEEVAKWWREHRTKLFEKNLRGVLGETEVNEDIRKTLENSPEKFWYYNNGITIICKNATKTLQGGASRDIGQFKLEGISIVNGAQSVSTIGKFSETSNGMDKLGSVYVPLRIISLDETSEEFGEQVTKTNNTQNKIDSRDFVSLDPQQMRLKTELAIDGITYHVSRSEDQHLGKNSLDLIESTTAMSCASGSVSVVVQLKSKISKLWDNLEKGHYKRLFNPSVEGFFVWRCVQVQRMIDSSLDSIISKTTKSGLDYGIAVHGNRIIALLVFNAIDVNQFKRVGFEFEKSIKPEIVEDYVIQFYNEVKRVVDVNFKETTLPVLFKNLTKCTAIVNEIQKS